MMKRSKLLVIACAIFLSCGKTPLPVGPENLRCEYLENPIGIDSKNPRFTWQIPSEKFGAEQKACQILVDTDSAEVAKGNGNVWDSGTLISSTLPISYQGNKLQPFTRYYWSVRVEDETGHRSAPSAIAWFETGMMSSENWVGQWITDSYDLNKKAAPYFRKNFETQKKIKSARIYIAVAGLYELYVNGNKIGDRLLDPMYTRFDRRTLYASFDVTANIQNGKNAIGVILGNGWYNHQSTAVWHFDKAPWRSKPKFCLNLRLKYDDGTEETISTGKGWKTGSGAITFNSIYTAEHVDARLAQKGWNLPDFDDTAWDNILATGAPSQNIVSQTMQPIRATEKIAAKSVTKQDANTYLFDFGRNIAGVSQLKVSGQAGTVLRLKHGERLRNDGRIDLSNIDIHYRPTDDSDPFQTDIYVLSGKGEETFMPKFNYKGFQYVEVKSDRPVTLNAESLTAWFMHSDVPPIGSIRTSNPVIDKIWQAANASYLSNLYGYPTDCPQREKNGWTGDAHICSEVGLYNFDAITVYEKWMADHKDEQQPDGTLPAIIPTGGWGYHWANGPDWTSTIAIIPWNIYLFYGDTHILKSCYYNIKRYVDRIERVSPSGLTDWGLGDWVPVKSVTPKEFTSSIYYFVDTDILAKTAKILGKHADFVKYSALAEKIKSAINQKYLNSTTGIYGSGLQTELSTALKWGIVPENMKAIVAENLAKRVIADGKQIDVGLLGTKAILNALSENGYADLAYQLASRETFPSWGWWIVNGATTLYENWPLDAKSDISMNHIMFGEISAWFYKGLGGIFPDEQHPGFKNVVLKPNFVEGLEQFEAKHESLYGTIVSSWKKSGNKVQYEVVIPANSTATLWLDSPEITENGNPLKTNKFIKEIKTRSKMRSFLLKAGKYQFTLELAGNK